VDKVEDYSIVSEF